MNLKERFSKIEAGTSWQQLNRRTKRYVQEVNKILDQYVGLASIRSLILFGSQLRNSTADVSDCDLLIILDDKIEKKKIKELEGALLTLEQKHRFLDYQPSLLSSILFFIQRDTGMFVSHFITEKTDFIEARFHEIFNVNFLLSMVLAPARLVLLNMIDNSVLLFGDDFRDIVYVRLKDSSLLLDVIKSLAMNTIISLFSIVISPFKRLNPIKFSLEALKWSLQSINYYLFNDSTKLEKIATRFIRLTKSPDKKRRARIFYKKFLDLRKYPRLDIQFMIKSVLAIPRIHNLAFKYYPSVTT